MLLIQHWGVKQNAPGRQSLLHLAAKNGCFDAAVFLLNDRIVSRVINAKDENGNTAGHVAAMHENYKVLKAIQNHRMYNKLEKKTQKGKPPTS